MQGYVVTSSRRHTNSKRDWSSDVCSSDLSKNICALSKASGSGAPVQLAKVRSHSVTVIRHCGFMAIMRSEERRVGIEIGTRMSRKHFKGLTLNAASLVSLECSTTRDTFIF